MNQPRYLNIVTLILLSVGIYQIIAAGLALFFWAVAGDWQRFWPHILGIAFWINLPASHWVWQTYRPSHPPRR